MIGVGSKVGVSGFYMKLEVKWSVIKVMWSELEIRQSILKVSWSEI